MSARSLATLSSDRLPLLITGIAGVAGFNALPYFQARYPGQVVGVRPTCNFRLVGPNIEAVDVENPSAVAELFRRWRFRSVLDCGGNCALKACELDPAMAWRINVDSVQNLLDNLGSDSVRLVHLSSDLVFSGKGAGGYTEDDPMDAVTVYGKSMAEAERLICQARPDATILRISLPMGPSFNGHAGAIDWIASRFKKHSPATLYFDEIRTPTYCDDMNIVFERMLAGDESGLFHFGGPRCLSLYQVAQITNWVGGYSPEYLLGCRRFAGGPVPPRAGNVSMNSTKLLNALGRDVTIVRPWPAFERLVPRSRRWHFSPRAVSAGKKMVQHLLYTYPGSQTPPNLP